MPRQEFGVKHPPLTIHQILALDEGWQLDQDVAMLVMDWQACSFQGHRTEIGEFFPLMLIPPGKADHAYNVCPTPPYSTDERETWEVIDSVGHCCTWTIEISSEGCSVSVCGLPVSMVHMQRNITLQSDNRKDFAKMVCKAALLSNARQGSVFVEDLQTAAAQCRGDKT